MHVNYPDIIKCAKNYFFVSDHASTVFLPQISAVPEKNITYTYTGFCTSEAYDFGYTIKYINVIYLSM